MMANKRYMLAVDIGSTNIKARIYDGKFKVQASNSKKVQFFFFFSMIHYQKFYIFLHPYTRKSIQEWTK